MLVTNKNKAINVAYLRIYEKITIMGFCLIPLVPPLTPPETGGELTNRDISIPKNFKQKLSLSSPFTKGG